MAQRDLYEATKEALLPILIDNTRKAHRLSARLFSCFGVVSLIFGKPRVIDLFDPSSQTLRFPETACERLQFEVLTDLAAKYRDAVPVLIPCSERAEEFIVRHEALLASHFILSDAEAIFSHPLLRPPLH